MDCNELKIMIDEKVCFKCAFWLDKIKNPSSNRIIIHNNHYMNSGRVDKKTARGFIGFGGRDFKIKMDDGIIIETNNLWHQGEIPLRFRDQLPDNAIFI